MMFRYEAFRDQELAQSLSRTLHQKVRHPVRFMEVCGTHTMSIFRYGLRDLFPSGLAMVSGPGCPVCVTSQRDIDTAIAMSKMPGVILTTFGDLVRVPGTTSSLNSARANGAKVEIVYSPLDSLRIAKENPNQITVFLAIGFETTIPAVAATVKEAERTGTQNICFFIMHKLMPPALKALLADPELGIDGLLCPGHVSTIIGMKAYEPIAKRFRIPCVIAGFEPADILKGLILLSDQVNKGRAEVQNAYTRAVLPEGNKRAIETIYQVFEPSDASWRGLGTIPGSGLKFNTRYSNFDALKRLEVDIEDVPEPRGCLCGEILKGKKTPPDCPLFAMRCTPLNPVGPCMVSNEGSCAAYFRYGIKNNGG